MRILSQHQGSHAELADQLTEEETEGFRGERERVLYEQHVVYAEFSHDAQTLVDAHELFGIGDIRWRLFTMMGFRVLVDDARPGGEQDDNGEGVVGVGEFDGSSDHRTMPVVHAVE